MPSTSAHLPDKSRRKTVIKLTVETKPTATQHTVQGHCTGDDVPLYQVLSLRQVNSIQCCSLIPRPIPYLSHSHGKTDFFFHGYEIKSGSGLGN